MQIRLVDLDCVSNVGLRWERTAVRQPLELSTSQTSNARSYLYKYQLRLLLWGYLDIISWRHQTPVIHELRWQSYLAIKREQLRHWLAKGRRCSVRYITYCTSSVSSLTRQCEWYIGYMPVFRRGQTGRLYFLSA